jgi:hypothetical protein
LLNRKVGSCGKDAQLSPPRIRRYNPFRPKKLRKYHDSDDTHRTSISGVSMPRCSIDLNPSVNGKGSLTVGAQRITSRKVASDALRTNPWKKKLIQPIITICGTIMTICVFIPAIIPSMAAGSVRGLRADEAESPFGGPSLRYVPDLNASERFWDIAL